MADGLGPPYTPAQKEALLGAWLSHQRVTRETGRFNIETWPVHDVQDISVTFSIADDQAASEPTLAEVWAD